MKSKICVIGLGYIGLPTAAMLAKVGWNVTGVDINPDLVRNINSGVISIEEIGLKDLVSEAINSGSLKAKVTPNHADYFIVAVPTPITSEKIADMTYVIDAINAIIPFLKEGNIIIIESTIPPNTIDKLIAPLIEQAGYSPGIDIFLAHCPERVLPGNILRELVYNIRIIGGINEASTHKAAEVYKSFVKSEIINTSALTAEMSKLMENTYRDVNIALANEFVKISAHLSINVLEAIKLANLHPRVNILDPGPGVGGHCIAIDPYFIIEKAPQQASLISIAREVNNSMPAFVVEQVKKILPLRSEKVAIFGLAYKGNVGDTRESPAIKVLEMLKELGYSLSVYDSFVQSNKYPLETFEECLDQASLLLVLVDHNEFKNLDEDKIIRYMKSPTILDVKNIVRLNHSDIKVINYSNLDSLEMKESIVCMNRYIAQEDLLL